MFTAFEWYFLASMGYPVVSVAHAFARRESYDRGIRECECNEAQVIELFSQKTSYSAPIYAGSEHVKIPIGGGSYTDWSRVGSGGRFIFGKNTAGVDLFGVRAADNFGAYREHLAGQTYANDPQTINALLESYGMTDRVPIMLPMRIDTYKLPGPKVYLDSSTKRIDTNRQRLLRDVMFTRRLPGTLTIPVVGLAIVGTVWGLHLLTHMDNYNWSPPPTDILGKITGNTSEKRGREAYEKRRWERIRSY